MQRSSLQLLADAFLLVVSLLWIVWVSADYFGKFILFGIATEQFAYYGLAAQIVVFFILQYGLANFGKKRGRYWMFTGWWLVLFGLVCIFLVHQATYNAVLASSNKFPNKPLALYLGLIKGLAGPFIFILTAFATGDLVIGWFGLKFRKRDLPILRLLIGFGVWMTVLFLLGIPKALNSFVVVPLCLLPIALRYKVVWKWFRQVLVQQHKEFAAQLGPMGILSLLGIVMVVSINLMRIQTPLPTGSDAQNYYINLARLIDDYQGLVHGFQPYNWSLVTALGYLVGNGTPAALVFSMMGGILSLSLLFRIGKTLLGADPNVILFSLLLFVLTPTMVVQSVAELKVDLGLLFMSLGAVYIFWYAIRSSVKGPSDSQALLLLFGLICGWLLGIKLTSLFLVMGLIAAFWYTKIGFRGLLAAVLLGIGVSLVAGMDTIIQIDQQHLGRSWVMAACLAGGFVLLVIEFLNNRKATQMAVRQTAVIVICSLVTFLPWVVKNAIETGSPNPRKLLMGAEPGLDLNIGDIRELMGQ